MSVYCDLCDFCVSGFEMHGEHVYFRKIEDRICLMGRVQARRARTAIRM